MKQILDYYNQRAQAEANGMEIDWRGVSMNIARMIAAELANNKEQDNDTQRQIDTLP